MFSQVGFGGHARHGGEVKSRNDLHSICFPRHTREPQGADGGARPSTLRPWQSHAETDVNVTMSRSLAGMREDRKMQMVQPNRRLLGHGSRTAVMFLQHVAREATHATRRCLPSSFSSVRAGIQAFGHIRRTPPIFLRRVALQATHATNRFLHGLNAPISRVGEPEQWSHEPIPCPQLHIKAGVG